MKPVWVAILTTSLLICSTLSFAQEIEAVDRLQLKSGGEILGKLITDSKVVDKKKHFVFKTESGGMLQLEKSMVSKVVALNDEASGVYQNVYASANDLESHWAAVKWCKAQKSGNVKYRNEINYHLRQVLKLDPNDAAAWHGIISPVTGNRVYRKRDGVWLNEVERFKSSGYVKRNNKWMSEEALRVIEQIEAADNTGVVNDVMKRWKKLLRTKPAQAVEALPQVIGKSTVVPLFNLATGEMNKKDLPTVQFRSMVMEAIGTIDSPQALNALVYFAVKDPDTSIRSRASTLLENSGLYHPENVVQTVVGNNFLLSKSSTTINRAALLLNRVGSVSAILPLIDALETEHTVATGESPGRMSTAARGGQVEGLKTGGGNATEQVWRRNRQVYQALRSLSRQTQDFGYIEPQWKSWYISKFTHTHLDVRADE